MPIDIVAGLLRRGDRILLGKRAVHRRAYPGVWDLPGGHREPGESPEQTLVRELREEIGVTTTAWTLLGIVSAPAAPDDADPVDDTLRLHLYLVTAWEGEPRNLQPDEHDAIAWLTVA